MFNIMEKEGQNICHFRNYMHLVQKGTPGLLLFSGDISVIDSSLPGPDRKLALLGNSRKTPE